MQSVNPVQSYEILKKLANRLEAAKANKDSKRGVYAARRGFYHSTLRPYQQSQSAKSFTTGLASVVVDRSTSYFMGNGFVIKAKPFDSVDLEQVAKSEMANAVFDQLYNSDNFQSLIHFAVNQGGRDGDFYLKKEVKDGMPFHTHIKNPEHLGVAWLDDTFSEVGLVFYAKNEDVDLLNKEFKVSLSPNPLSYSVSVGSLSLMSTAIQNAGVGTRQDINASSFGAIVSYTADPMLGVMQNKNMAVCEYLYDIVDDMTYKMINGTIVGKDEGVLPIYHIKANELPGFANGVCDFEKAAEGIAELDEKLSEMSDGVTRGTRIKAMAPTQSAAKALQNSINWKEDQVLHVPDRNSAIPGGDTLKILQTTQNTYSGREYIDLLINFIRTATGLQELFQDAIAANVSGKALQSVFQGTVHNTKAKQKLFKPVMHQIIKDDIAIMAKSDKEMARLLDEDGNLAFSVDIRFGAIIPQEESANIANIMQLTQGNNPLMSVYQGRSLLSDYIPDPSEEEKKIRQETEVVAERSMATNTANNVTSAAPSETAATPEEGIASTPGAPGGAQMGTTPEGGMAQALQNSNQGGI